MNKELIPLLVRLDDIYGGVEIYLLNDIFCPVFYIIEHRYLVFLKYKRENLQNQQAPERYLG